MLVKNLTPFFHAAKVTSRKPPQAEMTLVVRGTFRLVPGGVLEPIEGIDQGFLSGETFAEGDTERTGASEYPGDLADYKLNAEVMLRGTCHPPRGRRVTECPVRFVVGAWRKDLLVYGTRRWKGVGVQEIGEPTAFDTMPLDYAHAFGGAGSARNPVGRGAEGDLLPNVEQPGHLITSRSSQPGPASYAPVSSQWPSRAAKVGKNYGAAYLKQRAPYYADDFDWSHFHAAPSDQQLPGFLRGDEVVELHNLHPEQAILTTRLPALRVRAFMKDTAGTFREIAMSLDTLFAEPDVGTIKLTWRGLTPVREDDLADVRTVLIASEPLAGPHESPEHYREALLAYEADPTGVLAALPAGMADLWEKRQKQRRGEAVEEAPPDPALDPLTNELARSMGPLVSKDQLASVHAAVAKLSELPPEAQKPDVAKMAAEARAAADAEPPPVRMAKPGSLPDPRLRPKMRVVLEQVAALRARETAIGQRIEGIEAIEAIPHDPRWKQLDPTYEVPGPLSTDEPGPGADLRERDLRGRDLRGVDLRGANLERADLTRANLFGVCLAGAQLSRAILYQTDLEGADLREADLSLVNAANVRAKGADFTKANLSEAFFEQAVLEGAKLEGARADYAVFSEADMRGVRAAGANLDHADLAKAKLDKAQLRGVEAPFALFAEATLDGADLENAKLGQASFAEARCRGARFVGVQARKAFFMKTQLDGAEFGHADLRDTHLTEASLVEARLFGANLRGARLYRADLTGAQLVSTNLMQADLRKAKVDRANLSRANLYEAALLGLRGSGMDLSEANLERVVRDPS